MCVGVFTQLCVGVFTKLCVCVNARTLGVFESVQPRLMCIVSFFGTLETCWL